MHNFRPGKPFAPSPFIMYTVPLAGENFDRIFPESKENALLPVVTNRVSRFRPPNVTAVTISAGN